MHPFACCVEQCVDLPNRKVDVVLGQEELARRRAAWKAPVLAHQTPWEEMSREITGQLDSGACIERATRYIKIIEQRGEARHAH